METRSKLTAKAKAKSSNADDDKEEAELRALKEEGLVIDEDILEFEVEGIDEDGNDEDDSDKLDADAEVFDADEIAAIIEKVKQQHTLSSREQRFAHFAVTKVYITICTSM